MKEKYIIVDDPGDGDNKIGTSIAPFLKGEEKTVILANKYDMSTFCATQHTRQRIILKKKIVNRGQQRLSSERSFCMFICPQI